MLQAFCIPVPQEDADALSPRLNGSRMNGTALPEPPEGWDSWTGEVIAIATSCESAEAIDRLMSLRRPLLASLQRSRPGLYANIGEAIAGRLEELQRPHPKSGTALRVDAATAKRTGGSKRSKAPVGHNPGEQSKDEAGAERPPAEAA
jgi:hypothetical protein